MVKVIEEIGEGVRVGVRGNAVVVVGRGMQRIQEGSEKSIDMSGGREEYRGRNIGK